MHDYISYLSIYVEAHTRQHKIFKLSSHKDKGSVYFNKGGFTTR
jgi:hypothetical protein